MALVKWSDSLKIGEKKIDREHWGLFALVHDLDTKLTEGAVESSVKVTIEALVSYVDVHFDHEESLMRGAGYPEFDAHKKIHDALARRVGEFREDFLNSPKTFESDVFMEFLSNWLSMHIVKHDKEFATWYSHNCEQAHT